MKLNQRQEQVCLLMARGLVHEEIGRQLGISMHIAIAHGQKVRERLGVRNRVELLTKLLAD